MVTIGGRQSCVCRLTKDIKVRQEYVEEPHDEGDVTIRYLNTEHKLADANIDYICLGSIVNSITEQV